LRPQFEDPQLVVIKAQELPLSGQALLDLMQAVLARGGSFRFRARGWSMTPFIRDGDVITISPLRSTAPTSGEVVAFIHPQTNKLVVHRIVARRSTAWVIQGDNAPNESDGLIAQENILGRVTRVERDGRIVRSGLGVQGKLVAWLQATKTLRPLENLWWRLKKTVNEFKEVIS
jgi:hypothetical protein